MHIPNEITEDYLDHICETLKCELETMLDNSGGDEVDYDRVQQTLRHIGALVDVLYVCEKFEPPTVK